MNIKEYSSDAPVISKDQDLFSRWTFAERLGEVVSMRTDPSSIVVGLYGAWGDGKTSILNFVEQSLIRNQSVICIRFNPWRYSGEDELLKGLFFDIASALDTKVLTGKQQVSSGVKKFLPAIAEIFGAEKLGSYMTGFIPNFDLECIKNRIEEILEQNKKRVLILVDDVDRLEKNEIHMLFKTIKVIADFDYISYILAFDKQVVSASLQERYGSGTGNSGEQFLDKIIQVPLSVPYVEIETLRTLCLNEIDSALQISDISLPRNLLNKFIYGFVKAFDFRLSTPRKIKLYGNIINFSLPLLKNEVNTFDLLYVEAIKVFYPKLYESIKNNMALFSGDTSNSTHDDEDTKNYVKKLINEALSDVQDNHKKEVLYLLKELFPALKGYYNNQYFSYDIKKSWVLDKKICSEFHFKRYFTYSITDNDYSDSSINAMLVEISGFTEEDCFAKEKLEPYINSKKFNIVIRKINETLDTINVDTAHNLAKCLVAQSSMLSANEMSNGFGNAGQILAMLINDLFIKEKDSQKRIDLVNICLSKCPNIDFSLVLINWLKVIDSEVDGDENDSFSKEEYANVRKHLCGIIDIKYINKNIPITKISDVFIYSLIDLLCDNYDYSELEKMISDDIMKNCDSVYKLITSFCGTTTTANGRYISNFKKGAYEELKKYISPQIVISAIDKFYPDLTNEYVSIENSVDYIVLDDGMISFDKSVYLRQFRYLFDNTSE